MIRILLILVAMAAMALPAEAQPEPTISWHSIRARKWVCREWGGCDWEYRWRRVRVEPRYYAAPRRDWDEDRWRERGGRYDLCLPGEVDVLSTEHQTEDNAREAARKLWMAKTQWTHGGQYMDLDEAAHIRWRCGPSNAHDTAAGKLSEAAGVLTGKGGQNVRCALWARPCRVERKGDDIRGRR